MAEITPGTQFIGMAPGLDLKERRSASTNSKTEVYTLEDIQETVLDLSTPPSDGDVLTYDAGASAPVWSALSGGGSEYTETIVNISSAQILAIDLSPIELLPPAGVNKYYDIESIIIEYTFGTIAYGAGTGMAIRYDSYPEYDIRLIYMDSPESSVFFVKPESLAKDNQNYLFNAMRPTSINTALIFALSNGTNVPTLGDGTLRVKIYHKTITFGA